MGACICQSPPLGGSPPRARLKTTNYPNLQSVTRARTIFHPTSNFFSLLKNAHRVALAKDSQLIYNGKTEYYRMLKNNPEDIRPIEVDTVSGEFFVRIPEWVVNDQGWFEDTEVNFKTDGGELIIKENA